MLINFASKVPNLADSVCLAVEDAGLSVLVCCDCWFKSRQWHGCLCLVRDVCCRGRGLCEGPIPRSEKSYRVCVCVCVCQRM